MTNGEKFKQIFSITQVDEGELYAFAWLPNHDAAEFSIDWWNANYSEIPTGSLSLTKNNLEDAQKAIYEISKNIKFIDPSVTPQEPRKGHWNDIPKYTDIAWQCSECEHFTTMKHNYCPECGAKMVEP